MKFNQMIAPITRGLMLGLLSLSLAGCAFDFGAFSAGKSAQEIKAADASAEVTKVLAPAGVLRVGVYPYSPEVINRTLALGA